MVMQHVLKFEGQKAWIDVGHPATLGLKDNDFMVEAWVRREGMQEPDGGAVLGTAAINGLHLGLFEGRPAMSFAGPSTSSDAIRAVLKPNVWYHLLWRYHKASGAKAIFINGVMQSCTMNSAPFTGDGPLLIGQGCGRSFQGEITEVRIWRGPRPTSGNDSPRETNTTPLKHIYRRLAPGGDYPDLLACWSLTPNDRVALIKDPKWVHLSVPLPKSATDPLPTEETATFDGVKSCVRFRGGQRFDLTTAFTLEAWVWPTGTRGPSQHPVISRAGNGLGFELCCSNGGAELMAVQGNGTRKNLEITGIATECWHHLAATFEGNKLTLFHNGLEIDYTDMDGRITPYLGDFVIGAGATPVLLDKRFFAGKIAEVRIWNRARTEQELQAALLHPLQGDEFGLCAYWRLVGNIDENKDTLNRKFRGDPGTPESLTWEQTPTPMAINGDTPPMLVSGNELAMLRREHAKFDTELSLALMREAAANMSVDGLNVQLKAKQADIEKLHYEKNELTKEHATALAKKQGEFDAEVDKKRTGVKMEELIVRTNTQIVNARQKLSDAGGRYKLARVSVELKMLPSDDGTTMSFPSTDDLTKIKDLSTLNLDFAPEEVNDPEPPDVKVPDVIGYTEALASRKLEGAGFVVELNYQAVVDTPGEPSKAGRVVNQIPKKEKLAKPDSTVAVFIGKLA